MADRESLIALRRKLQQASEESKQGHSTVEKTLREQADHAERQREAINAALKRGDRAVADELLSKMGELNEKLGMNMQVLEDELVTELRTMAERQDSFDRYLREASGLQSQVNTAPEAAAVESSCIKDLYARLDGEITDRRQLEERLNTTVAS